MRSPLSCPFEPGSDHVPQIWAGRAEELADAQVVTARRLSGVYERGRAYLGEFGIGKSVLVNRIASDAAAAGHWVSARVRLARGDDPLAQVAASLRDLAARHELDERLGQTVRALFSRVERITVPGGGIRLRAPGGLELDHRVVTDLLVRVARLAGTATSAALPDGPLVLVRIDEIQNARDAEALSQLLTALGDALDAAHTEADAAGIERQRLLPLAVYLSGLPDFGRLAADAGATFSRRFRTVELDVLSEPDLRGALAPFTTDGWPLLTDEGSLRVHMDPGAVDGLVERCLGDPFLFQLAGQAGWNAGTGPVITTAEMLRGWQSVRREVLRYVDARLDGLTDLQLSYLEAAAFLGEEERTSAAVARALGRPDSRSLGSTAQALDDERRLIRRRAGRVSFRSPLVASYLEGAWP